MAMRCRVFPTVPPWHAAALVHVMDRQDEYIHGVNWAPDSSDEDEMSVVEARTCHKQHVQSGGADE